MNTKFQIKNEIEALKQKLYVEVDDYNKMRVELFKLRPRLDLLREICEIFESHEIEDNIMGLFILLELAYDKSVYTFYEDKILDYVTAKENLKEKRDFFEKEIEKYNSDINTIYNTIKNELDYYTAKYNKERKFIYLNKFNMISFRKIISAFKYENVIEDNDRNNLIKYLKTSSTPNDKVLLIKEIVNDHNVHVRDPKRKIRKDVIEMYLKKFHTLPVDESTETDELKKLVDNYTILMKTDDYEENIKVMPKLSDGKISEKDFDYIYKSVINNIVDQMEMCKNDLCDDNVYNDKELKKLVCDEYVNLRKRLICLFDGYKSDKNKYFEQKELEKEKKSLEIIENIEEDEDKRNLLFLKKNDKVYIESDMKDIPEEYYERVYTLIDTFRNGTLNKDSIRQLVSNNKFRTYRELRDDQVRIVYKEVGNNNYLILGVGVKKDNVDYKLLTRLTKRYKDLTDDEIEELKEDSKEEIESIKSLYLTKGRKGNR